MGMALATTQDFCEEVDDIYTSFGSFVPRASQSEDCDVGEVGLRFARLGEQSSVDIYRRVGEAIEKWHRHQAIENLATKFYNIKVYNPTLKYVDVVGAEYQSLTRNFPTRRVLLTRDVEVLDTLELGDYLSEQGTEKNQEAFPSDHLASIIQRGMSDREKAYAAISPVASGDDVTEGALFVATTREIKDWIKAGIDQAVSMTGELLRQRGVAELIVQTDGNVNSAFDEVLRQFLPRLSSQFLAAFVQALIPELAGVVKDQPWAVDYGQLLQEDGVLKIRLCERPDLPRIVPESTEEFQQAEAL